MSTQLPETFDPENQEGNSWELLPVGEYVAQIIEVGVQKPKNGDGFYVALTWKIVEGDFDGRQVWQRITFIHSGEQAQAIGRKTFKDLTVALGISEHVKDVEVFLFKPAKIKVGVEIDKAGVYNDKNKVTRILPLAEVPPAAPVPAAPKPAAPTLATKPQAGAKPGGKAPWQQG
jgi:hypothetical protein